jgi:protein ImuB
MRRVVSVWLPTLATDRLRRRCDAACLSEGLAEGLVPEALAPDGLAPGAPLVLRAHDGRRLVVAATDETARRLGVWPGMPLAQAQAVVRGLTIVDSDPAAEARLRAELAAWALRYAPLTAADDDGFWIDVTGAAHLQGGERALLRDMVGRLRKTGIAARAAVADTPGAAHAVARHSGQKIVVVPPGGQQAAMMGLPVAALRIEEATVRVLHRLGLERIGQMISLPRGPVRRRLDTLVLLRLDQALGRVAEPIEPVTPPETIQHRLGFVEPLLTAEALGMAIAELVRVVCVRLEQAGQGARRLDLWCERVDGSRQVLGVGTARPVRDARHLTRLLQEQVERIDPGLGIEILLLAVPLAEELAAVQVAGLSGGVEEADVAPLIDRLANRFGAACVYGLRATKSEVPERSTARRPALGEDEVTWPDRLPRPVRLFDPPQPVEAIGVLPDEPPAAFTWRRVRHLVRRADGPERITGEWWRRDAERAAVRDYWIVEAADGRRFWLFRRGDGVDPETGDLAWFLQGVF